MNETCPCRGAKDLEEARDAVEGFVVPGLLSTGIKLSSKASPGMNNTGNDSGVDLNNSWPRVQNSVNRSSYQEVDRWDGNTYLGKGRMR